MTGKERKHTNKVLSVLKRAVRELDRLSEQAITNRTYPITTQKALLELNEVVSKARIRILAGSASVV